MSGLTIEDILAAQERRIQKLGLATKLINRRDELKDEILELNTQVYSVSSTISDLQTDLNTVKSAHNEYREMSRLLTIYDRQIQHMEKNIPPEIKEYVQADTPPVVEESRENKPQVKQELVSTPNNTIIRNDGQVPSSVNKNCKKTLFGESDIRQINVLSEADFQKIPKYIIGRNTLDALNGFILNLNSIIKSKYSLVFSGQAGARKKGELDLYLHYKKQQAGLGKEEDHTFFFVAEDYERYIKAKIDKTKLNFISALRHCKRLREIRTSKMVHYALI